MFAIASNFASTQNCVKISPNFDKKVRNSTQPKFRIKLRETLARAKARAGKVEGEGDGEYMSVRARRQARGATSRNNLGALLQKINDLTFTENSATRY